VLAGAPPPLDASVARQAIGIVHRDFGDLGSAVAELRHAVRLARRAGSRAREADVLATLGVALIHQGRTRQGLAALGEAVALAGGGQAAQVLYRRAYALWMLGRHREALEDLRRAVPMLAGDPIWTARAVSLRGLLHLSGGLAARAEADLMAAGELSAATGQELEAAYALHNRGLVAFRSGDLPGALSRLDEAAHGYEALDVVVPDLGIDRCAVLLTANLPADALAEATSALDRLGPGQAAKRAELLLTAARCALAAGDPQTAVSHATAAVRLFGSQDRPWWQAHARLARAQARFAAAPDSDEGGVAGWTRAGGAAVRGLAAEVAEVAARLDALGSAERVQAHLLAGRIALAAGRLGEADGHLAEAAAARSKGPPLARVTGWLAQALRRRSAGDGRGLLRACRRGLELLDEHRLTLGA
jgi:tetratricopeptide (TPR) repeat protein